MAVNPIAVRLNTDFVPSNEVGGGTGVRLNVYRTRLHDGRFSRKQQALGEQLSNQMHPAGAGWRPDRALFLTRPFCNGNRMSPSRLVCPRCDHRPCAARGPKRISIKRPISSPDRIESCTVSATLSARDEHEIGSRGYLRNRGYAHDASKHPNQTPPEGVPIG